MEGIPADYEDLFEKKTFAHVATLMPEGTPQVTPVWIDYDGEHVLFNTTRGRQKEQNITDDPRIGVSIIDPDNPYRYLSIRGEVDEVTEDGAVEHIDALAQRYMDVDEYPYHGEDPGDRVIVKIRPDRVDATDQTD